MGYLAEVWPPAGITIRTPALSRRPMSEPDAAWLALAIPADLDQDPRLPRYPGVGQPVTGQVTGLQAYWRNRGAWTPDDWCLTFGAWPRRGESGSRARLVGTQTIEGADFSRLRVVDSASMLLPEHRGKGLGKQMRRGVPTLAFAHLGTRTAVSGGWHDNAASLCVSRSLGFEDNGVDMHARGDSADVMQRSGSRMRTGSGARWPTGSRWLDWTPVCRSSGRKSGDRRALAGEFAVVPAGPEHHDPPVGSPAWLTTTW